MLSTSATVVSSGTSDLTGKLIIKARLGDDIRRIPIYNEDLTYNELVLMMQRVFRGTLTSEDDVTIKYADEDGDLITIFDDSDVILAIQMSRVLKLTIFSNAQPQKLNKNADLQEIRKELVHIRNNVNQLLDHLSLDGASESAEKPDEPSKSLSSGDSKSSAMVEELPATSASMINTASNVSTYESAFDPLTASQTQQAFSGKGERPPSPVESSASVASSTQLHQNPPAAMPFQQLDAVQQSFGVVNTQPAKMDTGSAPQLSSFASQPPASDQLASSFQTRPTQQSPAVSTPQMNVPPAQNAQYPYANAYGQPGPQGSYPQTTNAGYPPQNIPQQQQPPQQQHQQQQQYGTAPNQGMGSYGQQPQDQSSAQKPPSQYGGMHAQTPSSGGYQQGGAMPPPQPNYHQPPRGPPGPQQGYMQQPPPGAANPHRMFGRGSYRPRQPTGPGYQ